MEKSVDLNLAFAKHWDTKNPSNFVKACDESRTLQEEEEKRKEKRRILVLADTETVKSMKKDESKLL